jgi:myosin heavy subunit
MTLKGHLFSSTRVAGVRASANELRMGRLLRDPEAHVDDAAAEAARKAAAELALAEAARLAAEEAGKTKTAEEAKAALDAATAELEELKTKLASFDGVDPEVAKANAKKVEEAEKAAAEAKKAAKDAEKARAQAENDVTKLREIQAEEHKAELDRVKAEKEARDSEVTTLQEQLNNIRVENAFANSKFITEQTILTGGKAQRLFGDYVDVVDGQAVVYDAPRGDEKRAKVMDSKGNALPFNDAIAKVINADPDKDSLLKSKTKPGTGSKTEDGRPTAPGQSRHEKLAGAIGALRQKNAR